MDGEAQCAKMVTAVKPCEWNRLLSRAQREGIVPREFISVHVQEEKELFKIMDIVGL